MKKQATGGKRLQRMLPKIDRGGLWIDTYNQCVNDIAGTIKARVNANCMYFVSEDSRMKKTDRVMTVESGLHRAYRMYITDGVSPAITTPSGGGLIPKIIEMKEEPKIVSYSRDKKGKIENYHTKEVSNTITSVQKDNMLLEPLRIKANTREGFAEVEEYGAVNISQPSSRTRRGRVQGNKGDIIGTLLTGEENAVLEPKAEEVRRVAEEVRRQPCGVSVDKDNNLRPYRQDKAKSGVAELQTEFAESVGSTLTSARPNNVYGDTFPYRIRRLIPRECFRLMDVDDEDYYKIKNYVKGHRKNGKPMYISESQQYKLAGNSIVVACMEHIFEQLFFPSGRVTEPKQLDIFDII